MQFWLINFNFFFSFNASPRGFEISTYANPFVVILLKKTPEDVEINVTESVKDDRQQCFPC